MTHIDKDVEAPVLDQRAVGSDHSDSPSVGVAELVHAEVRARLSDYLDGSLSPSDQARVRQHLEQCESCRAFRNTLKRSIDLTSQLPLRPQPERTKRRILDQFKSASRPG